MLSRIQAGPSVVSQCFRVRENHLLKGALGLPCEMRGFMLCSLSPQAVLRDSVSCILLVQSRQDQKRQGIRKYASITRHVLTTLWIQFSSFSIAQHHKVPSEGFTICIHNLPDL